MAKPNDLPGDAPRGQAADQASAAKPLSTDASAAAVRPFLDAHTAYLDEVRDAWQAAQQGLKDAYCAHAKAQDSLRTDWTRTVAETARQFEEGVRTALGAPPAERQSGAAGASSRYHTEVSLAQTAAAAKWTALQKELQDTLHTLGDGYADRYRSACRNFLNALKTAWQSVDVEHLDPVTLAHIHRLTGEAVRCAWHTRVA